MEEKTMTQLNIELEQAKKEKNASLIWEICTLIYKMIKKK